MMKRKIHNMFLKITGLIAMATLMIAISALDSESNIPVVMFLISIGYLALLGLANDWGNQDDVD